MLSLLAAERCRDGGPCNIERGSNSTGAWEAHGREVCGVKLTCPLRRLISFFLVVADSAMLCGEMPAVIFCRRLSAAANGVTGENGGLSIAGQASRQPARERVNVQITRRLGRCGWCAVICRILSAVQRAKSQLCSLYEMRWKDCPSHLPDKESDSGV